MPSIKVAIVGIGSCASSLIQLVTQAKAQSNIPLYGVAHPEIAGFKVADIEIVAAIDVDIEKVGRDLSEAIFRGNTAAVKFAHVPFSNVVVQAGPLRDGLDGKLRNTITPHPSSLAASMADVIRLLEESSSDVLLCHLPTGASTAIRLYAEAAAEARVAFINSTPERIARDPELERLFTDAKVPLLGDDTKSMVGATTLHTALIELLREKAVQIIGTYQINVGGNADFLNLSDSGRSLTKVESKRNALTGAGIDASQVLAGPNGYVATLGDTKICHLNIEAHSVLGSPLKIDLRLEVEDSPNAAGVMIDAIRIAGAAKRMGVGGVISDACPFLFKSPPLAVSLSQSAVLFQTHLRSLDRHTDHPVRHMQPHEERVTS